jgi:malate dehydrogenase (oxaloacetate-decarboxylating)(NADP+)
MAVDTVIPTNPAQMDKEALEFHSMGKPGKIEVNASKSTNTEKALSLAYSPGVAAPCKAIFKDPSKVFDYTAKGNLVAVISNGTAVLGLGNIGPLASKPVMEGKGILFKQFAGIDVFDIELNANEVELFISTVKALEPTFGGINLEDIKAPECFEIEERLKKEMKIPVFHDDQHGTAIISGAALLNACELTNKKMSDIKIVVNGAGAAAISCSKIFVSLGAKKQNIIMCDSSGVIYKGRKEGMNPYKELFAVETKLRTLKESLEGADVFIGLSVAGAVTEDMIKPMAKNPIIFAMANPDPEILPPVVKKIRPDAIVATGRSDFPNQVNNVLGFPSIFRGALDTRATQINEEMKLAAVKSLAALAKQDVTEQVSAAYGGKAFKFGPDYLIPKPFDTRVLQWVAPAVAKASMDSGVAQKKIENFDDYRYKLEAYQGPEKIFIRSVINKIQSNIAATKHIPKIVFPEGGSTKILKALQSIVDEKVCEPILLGNPSRIKEKIKEMQLDNLGQITIVNPWESVRFKAYAEHLFQLRCRKGVTLKEAEKLMTDTNYYAAMMVEMGDADGMVTGSTSKYAEAVRPILQTIGLAKDQVPCGVNLMLLNDRMLLLADTTVHFDPDPTQLAKISVQCARVMEYFGQEPRIAMLSFSNFSGSSGTPTKMRQAVSLAKQLKPGLKIDGEMQSDTAVNTEIMNRIFPFCELKESANILVFPNLESANISYKLLQQLGKGEVIGPFLLGVRRSANILQRTTTVDTIVNSVVLTSLEAQVILERKQKR